MGDFEVIWMYGGKTLANRLCSVSIVWRRVKRVAHSISAIALFCCFMIGIHVDAHAEKEVSKADLQADIKETYDLLKRYHPNLTTHTSKAELDALFDRIQSSLPERSTKEEAYLAVGELVGAVCDEHTQAFLNSMDISLIPDGWPWYKHLLIVDQGKLFVENPDNGQKEEIISVGETSGADIAARLIRHSPTDGCADKGIFYVSVGLAIHGRIISEMIGSKGPFVVKTRSVDSEEIVVRTIPDADHFMSVGHRNTIYREIYQANNAVLRANDFEYQNISKSLRNAGLYYRYSPSRNLAYLRIDAFKRTDVVKNSLDTVMRDVIRRNPDALVIDLVSNSGGSTSTAQLFMAYLLPTSNRMVSNVRVKDVTGEHPPNFSFFDSEARGRLQFDADFFRKIKLKNGVRSTDVVKKSFGKPDYKGPLYILVGPKTSSNSLRVAANLKRLRDAKIVGRVKDMNTVTFCARAHGTHKLRNTGILLRIPEMCYRTPENRFNENETLVSDVLVDPFDGSIIWFNALALDAALKDFERNHDS